MSAEFPLRAWTDAIFLSMLKRLSNPIRPPLSGLLHPESLAMTMRCGIAAPSWLCFHLACLLTFFALPSRADDQVSLADLADEVAVYSDTHGIPHIYAHSWTDAARVLGYIHAGDRLWQMDMFRRQASGATAELLGKDALPSDILMRQLGIRRSCEALWNAGDIPADLRAELLAYAAGVNARIAALDDKTLPVYFQALGYRPAPWTPVDSLVFSKYMGWDQSGTLDDLWFGTMVEKLGVQAAEQLWPLERPYEVPTVHALSLIHI